MNAVEHSGKSIDALECKSHPPVALRLMSARTVGTQEHCTDVPPDVHKYL